MRNSATEVWKIIQIVKLERYWKKTILLLDTAKNEQLLSDIVSNGKSTSPARHSSVASLQANWPAGYLPGDSPSLKGWLLRSNPDEDNLAHQTPQDDVQMDQLPARKEPPHSRRTSTPPAPASRELRTLIYCMCSSKSGGWENIRIYTVRRLVLGCVEADFASKYLCCISFKIYKRCTSLNCSISIISEIYTFFTPRDFTISLQMIYQ